MLSLETHIKRSSDDSAASFDLCSSGSKKLQSLSTVFKLCCNFASKPPEFGRLSSIVSASAKRMKLDLLSLQKRGITIFQQKYSHEAGTIVQHNMSIAAIHQNGVANNQKKKFFHSKAESEEHEEHQYLKLIRHILDKGAVKSDRTGVGTHSVFGTQMRFSLRDGVFPLLTTKRVFWRAVVEELLWFIRGSTNANELSAKGVKIWDANASRHFLDSLGFTDREEGDLGPVYGFQWRHFGAKYVDMHTDYTGQGFDQLADVIDKVKNNPDDRRIIMSSWNPVDIPKMALPPCHSLAQFYVCNGELSCQLYQRAGDMGLGVPFNIASYSLLTCMIAHVAELKPGEFVHSMGDTHVYRNHVEPLKEQVLREPRPFPKLRITREVTSIDDFKVTDFELEGYNPHPKLSMAMAL